MKQEKISLISLSNLEDGLKLSELVMFFMNGDADKIQGQIDHHASIVQNLQYRDDLDAMRVADLYKQHIIKLQELQDVG